MGTAAGEDPRAAQPIDYAAAGAILFDRILKEAKGNTARLLRDRADIEALRFDSGGRDNHWAIWNSQSERFEARGNNPDDGGLPEFMPRPVTNMFHVSIQGLTSILDQSEPAQVFAPRTESDRDQAAADVAEDAVPVLREECGYDSQGHRHELNRLATLTSCAAYVLYYDNDPKYGMDDITVYRCTVCGEPVLPNDVEDNGGTCPTEGCGNDDPEAFEEIQDPEALGKPLTVPYPIGRLCGEPLTSFEFTLPVSARRAHARAVPWFLSHRRMSPLDITRMWRWAKDVATNRANWADGTLTKAYADEMRRLSSPSSGGYPESGGSQGLNDGPVVFRLHHDPIVDDEVYLPEGYYGVMIGETRGDEGPLPFSDADGQPFKNVLFRQWEGRPASAHGHPPSDDMIPIQKSRNLTQALIELTLMHYASPTTYIPDTVTFLDEPTGIPGDTVRYRSVDGQKPTQNPGQNPGQALFEYLEQQDAMMDRVSGLNAVLRGDRAKGDPTLGEVQILEERGMATFRAPLDSLTEFEKDLSFMLLAIARQTAWSPRFRRIRGENGQWEVKQFASADLDGQIDIVVNRASAWPRSPLMQQLRLREAVQMGILIPQQDPELQAKILQDMNLSHLKKSLDADRKYVAMQLERWKAAVAPEEIEPPDPLIENLPLGFYLKQQFLKGEQAQMLKTENLPVYEAMRQHLAMMQMAMMPPAPPEEGAGAEEEPEPEPGAKGELDRALADGTLQPDDGQPGKGRELQAAIDQGLLVPGDGAEGAPPGAPMQGPSIDQLTEAEIGRPIERPPAGGGL